MNYKIGQTRVEVMQVNDRGQTDCIHRGVVVGVRDNWVRVYNPDSADRGGEVSPLFSQWYAIKAPRVFCKNVGELKTPLVLPANL